MSAPRTLLQSRKFHAMMGDLARQWSHEGVHLTAVEFKTILCCYFHFALCEADGIEARDIPLPESTSKMDADRMGNLIEYACFISAQMGIDLSD